MGLVRVWVKGGTVGVTEILISCAVAANSALKILKNIMIPETIAMDIGIAMDV